jgi:hypothetical protein
MPCNSSPAPDILTTEKINHTVNSCFSWPTPTVSIIIISKPAASQSVMVSRVLRATPPNVSPEADGRINAFYLWLVLPYEFITQNTSVWIVLLGSTVVLLLFPKPVKYFPNASIKVLFQHGDTCNSYPYRLFGMWQTRIDNLIGFG